MQINLNESIVPPYIPLAIAELCLGEEIPEHVIFSELDFSIHQLRNQNFRLSYSDMRNIVTNCRSVQSLDHLSIKIGQYIQLHHLGLIGEILQHCQTLSDALYILERYSILIDPTLWLKVEQQGSFVILHYRKMIPLDDLYQHSQEVVSSIIAKIITQLFDVKDLQLDFEFASPDYAKQFNFLNCSVRWDQAETRIFFPISELNKPSTITLNNSNFLELKLQAEHEFKKNFNVKEYWIFRVLSLIHSHIHAPLNAKDFAQLLLVSRSTFFRKLNEYQINYEQLIQQVRMDVASKYLKQNKGSIHTLSDYLGFSHPSNFIKSFQQFFGVTPKQWQNLYFETLALSE